MCDNKLSDRDLNMVAIISSVKKKKNGPTTQMVKGCPQRVLILFWCSFSPSVLLPLPLFSFLFFWGGGERLSGVLRAG